MENSKIKNILVIDNHDSFVYNLVQILRENEHCQFDIVYNDQIDFSSLSRYDKILLSPGPGIPAEAGELLALIEHCKTTHDILGVCLGHQAIAESFGASLQQLPLPKHGHESPLTIVDPTDILYHGLTYPVQVGRYHSWIVNPHTLPSCLRISALDEEGHIMSLYHTTLPIRGVQYHPESIITRQGCQMINNWINEEKSL
ncbi:anthranilate synthase component II [Butyricimonas faecihominis]|uniref:anthranilate synthase component II n=1 Tax=Butyricimonas faecihominis TaxID=1472416 RepID=UPI0026709D72|nr:aminodeoxychorismate/anthranilate synthase component II [Butyricimonas faecihominis]